MTLPTAKDLKKLAAACRKAGIKSFKCEGFEIALTDEAPVSTRRSKKEAKEAAKQGEVASVIDEAFEEEALSQDALLMWSALPADGSSESQQ